MTEPAKTRADFEKIIGQLIYSYKEGELPKIKDFVNALPKDIEEDPELIGYLNSAILHEFNYLEIDKYVQLITDNFPDTQLDRYTIPLKTIWQNLHPAPEWIITKQDDNGTKDFTKVKVDPVLLANQFCDEHKMLYVSQPGGRASLQYVYDNGVYTRWGEDSIKAELNRYIRDFESYYLQGKNLHHPTTINTACNSVMIAPTPEQLISSDNLNTREDIINFQNGILYITKEGNTVKPIFKAEHNKSILSTIQLPTDYITEGEIPQPKRFIQFVNECIVEEDRENFLKYFAFIISNYQSYRVKKAMFIIGLKDSGKSVMYKLIRYLLGNRENCFELNLAKADDRFELANCFGKRLGGDADLRLTVVKTVDHFKRLTGGDVVSIEYKGKDRFDYTYTGALLFACNELPKMYGDESIYGRILPIKCNEPKPEEELDPDLFNKLKAEKQAIVMYLMPYLQQLIQDNFRIKPSAGSTALLNEFKASNDTAIGFFEEYCSTDKPEHNNNYRKVNTDKVYSMYLIYADSEGDKNPLLKRPFTAKLKAYFKLKNVYQSIDGKNCYNIYINTEKAVKELRIAVDTTHTETIK